MLIAMNMMFNNASTPFGPTFAITFDRFPRDSAFFRSSLADKLAMTNSQSDMVWGTNQDKKHNILIKICSNNKDLGHQMK